MPRQTPDIVKWCGRTGLLIRAPFRFATNSGDYYLRINVYTRKAQYLRINSIIYPNAPRNVLPALKVEFSRLVKARRTLPVSLLVGLCSTMEGPSHGNQYHSGSL